MFTNVVAVFAGIYYCISLLHPNKYGLCTKVVGVEKQGINFYSKYRLFIAFLVRLFTRKGKGKMHWMEWNRKKCGAPTRTFMRREAK